MLSDEIGLFGDKFAVKGLTDPDEDILVYDTVEDALDEFLNNNCINLDPLTIEIQSYVVANEDSEDAYSLTERREIEIGIYVLPAGDVH